MTDQELLELAAKAAGISIVEWHQDLNLARGAFFLRDGNCWNPLTDDGDALRLAVDLNLDLWRVLKSDEPAQDARAAARRALVKAAAEIGKEMP